MALPVVGYGAQRSKAPASAVGATIAKVRNGLIVFMRPGTVGQYDLWAVRPDGTGLRRLTEAPANRSDFSPAWSPDGSVVLFERQKFDLSKPGSDDALYVTSARGGRLRQITHCRGDCWSDGEAAWSSSGKHVVFSRATGPRSAPGPSLVAIYVAHADGSHVRRVAKPPHGSEDHWPTWSPDGHTILFQRVTFDSNGTPGLTKLIAVDVATGRERLIYRMPNWAPGAGTPAFSPSGKQLMFGYWCEYGGSCPPSTRQARNATLATIHPDGTGLRHLHLKAGAENGNWSPDGKQIVFRCSSAPNPPPLPPNLPPIARFFRVCTSKLNGTGFRRFRWPVSTALPDWGTHP